MFWTEKEIEEFKKYYPYNDNELLASEFNRTESSIKNRANKLGLKKINGKAGCFKKGNEPWNKGKPHPSTGNSAKGHFKAGHKPHNTKHDGALTVRTDCGNQYYFIRISNGKWEPLHRYNWINKYGSVPKGLILRCKDGNTLNAETDNWEAITRAEHVKRNLNRKKQAESTRKTVRIRHLRKIYELD